MTPAIVVSAGRSPDQYTAFACVGQTSWADSTLTYNVHTVSLDGSSPIRWSFQAYARVDFGQCIQFCLIPSLTRLLVHLRSARKTTIRSHRAGAAGGKYSSANTDLNLSIIPRSNHHSYLEHRALAPDAVEDTSVVYRDVLFCNHFDDLLRYNAPSEGSDVVQFSSTCSSAIPVLATAPPSVTCKSLTILGHILQYSS